MKYILRSLLFALMVFISQLSFAQKKFAHPERVRYDGSCMTIEGKDVFVYSAAFHYFRCPEELWRDRFRQIKEAGFNTVETYAVSYTHLDVYKRQILIVAITLVKSL